MAITKLQPFNLDATANYTFANITATNANLGNAATANYFVGNGSLLTGVTVSAGNSIVNGTSNITIINDGNVNTSVAGNANVFTVTGTGANVTGTFNATGNANVGNLGATGVVATTLAGSLTTASQPNITSVGILSSLSVTGNVTSGNANLGNAAIANFFIGSGNNLSNIQGSNVSGAVGLATYATTANAVAGANVSGQVGNALIAGTVYTAAQPNITSTGSLTGLTVSNATGVVDFTTTANVTLGAVANLHISGGSANYVLKTDGAGNLSWVSVGTGSSISNGNSNVSIATANGNVTVSAVGNANVVVITGTGANITGTANVSGNLTAGNLESTSLSITGGGSITGANLVSANYITGTLTTPFQPNITLLGTITDLDGTGNANLANLGLSGFLNTTGNITGGNLNTGGVLSVNGNANVGNIGALNAVFTGTGSFLANVNMNSQWINNVGYPSANTDVATKIYVDTIASSGISYHAPVQVATTTTLATATGGTTAYNSPNGAANGIGAYISTTGTFNLIDTANVQTVGTRILVKNEANAAWNGVYTYANTTAIVRSTDADQYGPSSVEELSINDYFFVQDGSVNKGVAYVVNAPSGTITFGTSNITFAEFSTSQIYDAGTGLSLSGTTFSINTAQPTITSVGTLSSLSVSGNITSGNANLGNAASANYFVGNFYGTANSANAATYATYIIGAAQPNITSVGTLSSLDVTGNITSGNASATTFTGNLTGNATTAGTVITAAQPNITSVGSLTGLTVYNPVGTVDFTGVANVSLGTVANVHITGGTSGYYLQTDGSGNLSWASIPTGTGISNGTSNVNIPTVDGNINLSAAGNANILVVTGTGAVVNGNLTSSNANLGNAASANYFIGNFYGTANSATTATTAGTVTTASQPNITSVGTLTSLGVNGTVTAVAFTANTGVFTGNGSGLSAIAGANVTGEVSYAATANAVAGANVSGQVNYAATANSVAGANVTGAVAYATTANSVAGGNVSGAVGLATYATTANAVAGANVSGAVLYATTANSVAGANVSGQVANALVAGTVYTNAQPNITSVGTLANLTVTGNATVGNLVTSGSGGNISNVNVISANTFIASGNITAGNANLGNAASANYFIGNFYGTANSATTATTAGTVTTASQPNITSVGTLTTLGVNGTVTAVAFTANTGVFTGNGSGLSAIAGGNVTGAVTYATTANSVAGANVSGAVAFATTANAVAGANVSGQVANALVAGTVYTAAQPNITSVGTLGSLAVSGLITASTITSNVSTGTPPFTVTSTTQVANLSVATAGTATTAGSATTAGTVTTAAQPNITSVGTLSSLSVTGNITSGNANLGNLVTANYFSGDGGLLTNITATGGSSISNGNSNVIVTANGNVSTSVAGNANIFVVSGTGIKVTGTANITSTITTGSGTGGNITGADYITANYFTGTLTTNAQPNITSVGTLTSLTITGTVSSGNANLGNTANANYFVGNFYGQANTALTAGTAGTVTTAAQPNITSVGTLSSLTISGTVTSGNANLGNTANANYFVGNFYGQANTAVTAGTVTTAAQPNITSVGTLSSLVVTGNISAGNANLGNLVTANFFSGNGNLLTGINFSSLADATTASLDIGEIYLQGVTNLAVNHTGATAYTFDQYTGSNPTLFITAGQTLAFDLTLAGHPFQIQYANGTNYNTGLVHVTSAGVVSTGTSAQSQTSGTLYWKVPNDISGNFKYQCQNHTVMNGTIVVQDINIANTLGTFTGNISANYFIGNGSLLTGVGNATALTNGNSNVIVVANSNVAISVGGTANTVVFTTTGTNVTGYLNATGNITSGNANLGNLVTANFFSGNGNLLTGINFSSLADATTASLDIGEIYLQGVTNLSVNHTGTTGYTFDQYTGLNPTLYINAGQTLAFDLTLSGHPFLIQYANSTNYDTGLVHVTSAGVVSTGSSAQAKTSGTLYWKVPNDIVGNFKYQCQNHSGMTGTIVVQDISIANTLATYTGNITAGNANVTGQLISTVSTGTAPLVVSSTTQVANLNAATAGTAGTVTTAAQPNITSVGTLTSLAVTGNITSGNVYANSGTIGASLLTGTITTANQPNITGLGTIGNLTVGYEITGNTANFSGAVYSAASVATPTQLATKQYVDNIASSGLNIHTAVVVATTANLNATYTSGGTTPTITAIASGTTLTSVGHGLAVSDMIVPSTTSNGLVSGTPYFVYSVTTDTFTLTASWNGPQITTLTNGTGLSITTVANSGVGSKLTNAGTQAAINIDGVALALNDRVLVKDQTTAAYNGVYTVTTVGNGSTNWVLTRSTDADEYYPQSSEGIGAGDYFFIQSGSQGTGDSYVVSTVGIIIIGTTSINFSQFSGAITYTGTSPIVVAGQTISLANTTGTTDVVVLATSPNLITPNIGNATGNSLTLTGNGYLSAVNVSASSNVTAGNVYANSGTVGASLLTGTLTTAAQPNITSVGTLTSLTVTGNVTGGNLTTGAQVVATGNVVGGNITTAGQLVSTVSTGTAPLSVNSTTIVPNLTSAYANIATSANVTFVSSNISYPTFAYAGLTGAYTLESNTAFSANLANGTFIATQFAGNLQATTANVTGNITAGNANLGNAATANYFVGNGSLLTGITVSAPNTIVNGNSNVSIPSANGNVNISAVGNANIVIITGTGANVTGYLTASGNVTGGNLTTAGQLVSTVSTGTAPLSVNSTTIVPNLRAATANIATSANVTFVSSNISYPTFAYAGVTGAYALESNTAFSANLANGAMIATTFVGALSGAATTAGTVTTAAQPNITSVGTLTSLGVNGTVTAVAFTANTGVFTGNGNGLSSIVGANVTGTVGSATNAAAVLNNVQTTGTYYPTFISATSNGNYALASNTAFSANMANGAIIATTFVGALSGAATSATTAGTVTTAAQPNITSVGTLTALTVGPNSSITLSGTTGFVKANSIQGTDGTAALYPYYGAVSGAVGVRTDLTVGAGGTGNLIANAGTATFGDASTVKITGGTSGYVLRTDGAGNLSWVAQSGGSASGISNGNSNVNIATANGNITMSAVGNANIVVVTGTGVNVAGTLNVTGNATVGNLISSGTGGSITNANVISANTLTAVVSVTAPQLISNVATGTAPFAVSSTTQVANLNAATAGTAGTVTTAAQPNITSVGTLTSLGVSGAVTASTLVSNVATGTAPFTVTSTTQVANLSVATAGTATTAGTVTTAAQPNITSVGTLTSLGVTGTTTSGNFATAGNITASFLVSNVTTGTAPLTVTSTTRVANLNVAYANVSDYGVVTTQSTGVYYPVFASGNTTANYALGSNTVFSANLANGAMIATTFVGALSGAATSATTAGTVTTAAQPNITSTGTLTSLGVTGTTTSGNFATAGNITASFLVSNIATGTAPLTVTSTTLVPNLYVSRANVADYDVISTVSTGNYYLTMASALTGNIATSANSVFVANAANGAITATTFVGALSGAATSATTAGTVTTAAQPNITSVGSLTGLTVSNATGVVNFITTANVSLGAVGNVKITGGSSGQYLQTDGSGGLSWAAISGGASISNGTSNVNIAASGGNVTVGVGGTAGVVTITSTGVNVSGTLNTGTGNATVGNLTAGAGSGGTISGANLVSANYFTGVITATSAAQPNITSVGSLTGLTVSNATGVVDFTTTANVSLGAVSNLKITGGTANYFLQTNGSGTLTWAVPSPTITDNTSAATTYYPVYATASSGSLTTAGITTTKLQFVPSTGTLTVTDLNTLSDMTLKENPEAIENPMEVLSQLFGMGFNWIDSKKKSYGLMAQMVEKILPELVSTNVQGQKAVNYIPIIAFLIEAVKKQQEDIEALKKDK